jgi:hypothetical protein
MIEKEEDLRLPRARTERLVRVLSDQRRVLMSASCDERVIDEYVALIRFLKSATEDDLRRIFPEAGVARRKNAEEPELSDEDVEKMPALEVQRLVRDGATSRKSLERIAILRFHVPRGSMRSLSNREKLVEKLSTLIQNEQAHETIETVARSQGELRGLRSKE